VIGVDQCEFDELERDPEVIDDADETDKNDMVRALFVWLMIECGTGAVTMSIVCIWCCES